jgi:hypothetical protein
MKKKFEYDNILRYRILTKPGGLTYKDIGTLICCGKTTAYKIINKINEKIASTPNSKIPIPGVVSREAFCEYMNWDFDEIESFALKEIAVISRESAPYTY